MIGLVCSGHCTDRSRSGRIHLCCEGWQRGSSEITLAGLTAGTETCYCCAVQLALSAASPIYRGFLADTDCRWNVISASVDDRTREERGIDVSRLWFNIHTWAYYLVVCCYFFTEAGSSWCMGRESDHCCVWFRVFVCVCLSVSLCVHALKGKWLELSPSNLVDTVQRHAVIKGAAGVGVHVDRTA